MDVLFEEFPEQSIDFVRHNIMLSQITGLFLTVPLAYKTCIYWDSQDGYDQQLKWWILIRLVSYTTSLPIRLDVTTFHFMIIFVFFFRYSLNSHTPKTQQAMYS